jgi:hypothetical protein
LHLPAFSFSSLMGLWNTKASLSKAVRYPWSLGSLKTDRQPYFRVSLNGYVKYWPSRGSLPPTYAIENITSMSCSGLIKNYGFFAKRSSWSCSYRFGSPPAFDLVHFDLNLSPVQEAGKSTLTNKEVKLSFQSS